MLAFIRSKAEKQQPGLLRWGLGLEWPFPEEDSTSSSWGFCPQRARPSRSKEDVVWHLFPKHTNTMSSFVIFTWSTAGLHSAWDKLKPQVFKGKWRLASYLQWTAPIEFYMIICCPRTQNRRAFIHFFISTCFKNFDYFIKRDGFVSKKEWWGPRLTRAWMWTKWVSRKLSLPLSTNYSNISEWDG